ncbi:MAG: glycosyltransferase [Sphingomonas bacterium]
MRWAVAAPFFKQSSRSVWIDDFVESDIHEFFKIVPRANNAKMWHSRKQRATPLNQWRDYYEQASRAVEAGDGVITVFPQLAACSGLARFLRRRNVPIVAWCFNVGVFPKGAKLHLAKAALRNVDRIVVHSRSEVESVTELLDLRPGIVEFVPLQCAPIKSDYPIEENKPFAVAMGSANRDYATLFQAAAQLDFPVTVVAAERSVEGLNPPPNVKLLHDLTPAECRELAQRARFSIVPLSNTREASGQVTVIEAMRMNRPVIATRSVGTEDYVEDGETGILVPPADPDALASAMRKLWLDRDLARQLADAGSRYAEANLSDQEAARSLVRILDAIAAKA